MSNFIRLSVPRQQDVQSNSIVVNATDNTITASNSDACYITPIRNQSGFPQSLYYNPATGEVAYADTSGGGGGGGGQWTKIGNLLAPIPTDVSGIALMNTIIRGTDLSACVIGDADNEIGAHYTNWTFIAGGGNKVSVPTSNFGYYCTIGGYQHKIGMAEGFVSGSFTYQGAICAGSSAFGASNRIGGVGANSYCPFGFAFGSGNAICDASGAAADHCVVGGDGNKIASGDVNASAAASIALGKSNIIASGSDSDAQYCVAIGRENKIAIGANDSCYTSVALGSNNTISDDWCFAIGSGNECSQRGAHAYGWGNLADASYACARGKECNASGISSLADGSGSIARTTCSVALGCGADASGSCVFVYRDTCGNTFCFDSGGGPGNGQLLVNGTAGAGGTGPTGPQGGFGGVTTCYYQDPDSNIVMDPTAGYMYFRTATTQYAASMLIVDASDCNQTNITEYMKTIMDSPNPSVKGHVRVSDSFSGTDNYLLYEINDLSYSGATPAWFEISVNGVASSSPSPFNSSLYPPNKLYLTFARMGDIGAEGPQGVTGPTGPAGSGGGGGGASPWHYDSSDNFYGPTGMAGQVLGTKNVIASNLNQWATFEGSGNIGIGWEVTSVGMYGTNNTFIGYETGGMQSGDNNICIGTRCGGGGGQSNNILLGQGAGQSGGLGDGGLVINATSATSLTGVNNGCVIKPIRNDSQVNALYYNTGTGEVTYDTAAGGGGGGTNHWKAATLPDGTNVLEPSANDISGIKLMNTIIQGTDGSGITIGKNCATDSAGGAAAIGWDCSALSFCSLALGYQSIVRGGVNAAQNGIAMGYECYCGTPFSFVVGRDCYTHAAVGYEGAGCIAIGVSNEVYAPAGYEAGIALGQYNSSTGGDSIAMGTWSVASGDGAFACGYQAKATNTKSVALGNENEAQGAYSYAMGSKSIASGDYSVALGNAADARGHYSVAMGQNCIAGQVGGGGGAFADGSGCIATGICSVAMGLDCSSLRRGSVAMGMESVCNASRGVAIGYQCIVEQSNGAGLGGSAIAIGEECEAFGAGCVALGYKSKAREEGTAGNWNTGQSYAFGNQADASGTGKFVYRDVCNNTFVFDSGGSSGSGALIINGGTPKTFIIPHPEYEGKMLRHACIETPTRGTNMYEYQIVATEANQTTEIALPSYFKYLNGRPRVYVSPKNVLSTCYGYVTTDKERVIIKTEKVGVFNVMVTGVRQDPKAVAYSSTENIDEPIAAEDIPQPKS